ncbi:MAG: CRTAC1 family protein [Planctomycetes bacterium]|nr:CRTAC1 family protein [Planctomycetota bacterium]
MLVVLIAGVVLGGYVLWSTMNVPEPETVTEVPAPPPEIREIPPVEIPDVRFTDVTQEAGIIFVHENGANGEKLLPETMGGGCAFFDYDNDGDPDILFVNSKRWPWDMRPASKPATLALYQNDGSGRFKDVTTGSGLDVSVYGQGAAVGDYDNDGNVDVFLSAVGSNRLFRNLGNGKFVDVTKAAGIAGSETAWSTSCGWFDFDNDGDLDLFVCNYIVWRKDYDLAQNFQLTGGGRAYGRPQDFQGTYPYLYRNDGNGKFTDVSKFAGVQVQNNDTGEPLAKSLGVTFDDFNRDGWLDIVVANDTVQNLLFLNQKNGTFLEIGAGSGVAFDSRGQARGAMGIDSSRFRNNQEIGIAIGNFSNEMTSLYVARDGMSFTDEAVSNGLGPVTRQELTFGLFFFDCDLDGRLDLFASNGHLEEDINIVQRSQHYAQPPQLLWNCGPEYETEFLPVPAEKCGKDFVKRIVGRGAAYADIDGDGDLDLLIASVGRAPRLLRNDQQLAHHWLRFKLTGSKSNADAIGSIVEVTLNDGTILTQQVMPTRSYLSQVELPVTFGLGTDTEVKSIRITWPSSKTMELSDLPIDQLHHIDEESELR